VQRIRKLLVVANDPRSNTFEATSARTIAYTLLCNGIRRGVVDFGDFLDLMPADMFDYQCPERGQ
jgi:hypothetical protein